MKLLKRVSALKAIVRGLRSYSYKGAPNLFEITLLNISRLIIFVKSGETFLILIEKRCVSNLKKVLCPTKLSRNLKRYFL